MEPQLIDCYNEMPHGVHIINKLNEEYEEVLQEVNQLKEQCKKLETENTRILRQCKKYQPPLVKISSIAEYDTFSEKIEGFEQFVKDIMTSIEDEGDDISGTISDDYVSYEDSYNQDLKTKTYIYKMIQELNKVTNDMNYEWCEYHILSRIEKMGIRHVSWILSSEQFVSDIMQTTYGHLDSLCCYMCEKCGQEEKSVCLDFHGRDLSQLLCNSCMPGSG